LKNETTEIKKDADKMKKAVRFGGYETTSASENVVDFTKGFDVEGKMQHCMKADSGVARKEYSDTVINNFIENIDTVQSAISAKFKNYDFRNFSKKSISAIDMSSFVDGGMFMPPVEMLPMVERVYRTYPLLQEIPTYVLSGTEGIVPYSQRGIGWKAKVEGESLNMDADQFKMRELNFKKVSVAKFSTGLSMTDESKKLMAKYNGTAIETMINQDRANELFEMQSQYLISGNPIDKQQEGLLTPFYNGDVYDVVNNYDFRPNQIGKLDTANIGVILMDDLIKFIHSTLSYAYRPNATLQMNSNTLAYLMTLKADNGTYGNLQYHFMNQGGAENANAPVRLFGIRILVNDFMPNMASNTVPIIFGDMSQAILQTKNFDDSLEVLAKTITHNSHYSIKYNTYFGSSIRDYQSFRYLKVA